MWIRSLLLGGLASLAVVGTAQADQWAPAGTEAGHRVAVNLDFGSPSATGPVAANLVVVPRAWPRNGRAYSIWVARCDCEARTRTVTARLLYGSRHDPRRTMIETPRPESGPAIDRQLAVVCRSPRPERTFPSLDALLEAG